MEVVHLHPEHLPQAAALFVCNFKSLRQGIPVLPDTFEDPETVSKQLAKLLSTCPGVAAFEQDRLVGFIAWYVFNRFREVERRTAYCPEWAHAAEKGMKPKVYRALYRAAAAQMTAAGCRAHAITLLARDPELEKFWFWNGFGLTVVDAVRSIEPPETPPAAGCKIRKAGLEDALMLAALEIEHWQHYYESPVLMAPQQPDDAAQIAALISDSKNAYWVATDNDRPIGFIRFEGSSFGAADIVNDVSTVAITGAFVRPEYRGRKFASAILHAALSEYSKQGYRRCSVDFESFNPEAAGFWMRYFDPVCLSVMRVVEREFPA